MSTIGDARFDGGGLALVGAELIEREGILVDERRWDDWLALFAEDCEYWVPMWKSEEALTNNPKTELSHIYYANRAGLEDRVVRIRSRSSPASNPAPRTTHLISSIRLTAEPSDDRMRLRSSWATHVFFPSSRENHVFFGHAEHELVRRESRWLFARKRIVLQNDFIPTLMDVYCL